MQYNIINLILSYKTLIYVCGSHEIQHSTEKSFQLKKKRKVDVLEKQMVKDIFSKKLRHHEKNIEKTRYLDLFIADLVRNLTEII
jgi:hypothetical protein